VRDDGLITIRRHVRRHLESTELMEGSSLPTKSTRREFLALSVRRGASLAFCDVFISSMGIRSDAYVRRPHRSLAEVIQSIPRFFCTAYITPDAPGQGGQEPIVARYPIALVPQDDRGPFRRWRDRVKALNAEILLLGYQMVIEETPVPGPGHDILRKVQGAWCSYPGGMIPAVAGWGKVPRRRIFDPRRPQWRDAFFDACRATLRSYPYAGLLLDQCTVYTRAHPDSAVRAEMNSALQDAIIALREEFPEAILVGNSSFSWTGLNGEMNEGRPSALKKELSPYRSHASPRVELCHERLQRADDIDSVRRAMAVAHSHDAFFGAAVDYQHVIWFDCFDRVTSTTG